MTSLIEFCLSSHICERQSHEFAYMQKGKDPSRRSIDFDRPHPCPCWNEHNHNHKESTMSADAIKKKTKRKLYSARKEVSLTCRRLGAALPFLRRTHAVHRRLGSSQTKTTSVHLHILQIKHETNEVHSYEMRGGKEGMTCPLCNHKMVGCYWEKIWCCRGLQRGYPSHSLAFLDLFF